MRLCADIECTPEKDAKKKPEILIFMGLPAL